MKTASVLCCASMCLSVAFLPFASAATGVLRLSTAHLQFAVSPSGRITELSEPSGRNHLQQSGRESVLLRVRTTAGVELLPRKAALRGESLRLSYPGGLWADVFIANRGTYLTLELAAVSDPGRIGEVIWGPFFIDIDQTVGTAVGVAHDDRFAFGIQALNVKTIAGYRTGERNRFGNAAEALAPARGTRLQAFSLNRSIPRVVDWSDQKGIRAEAIPGETVVGSKLALFGCPPERVLAQIGEIEVREGLPHPTIGGEWVKTSRFANRSKLIVDFTEANIDECIEMARRAGMHTIYSMTDLWESWGHFGFNRKSFPHGADGVRECVRKAAAAGITLGAHSLSGFITPADAYLLSDRNAALSVRGVTRLAASLDPASTEIPLAADTRTELYRDAPDRHKMLRVVRIDGELISYESINETKPPRLSGCLRGVYGTRAVAHEAGTEVARLVTHPYDVFFPGIRLLPEVARNLARAFNETGLSVIDLDGLEGGALSGHELYGEELFARSFYDALTDRAVINGSSELHHFQWHMVSNMSWGEPAGDAFRGAMTKYRIERLEYLEKNYIPRKMGQYPFEKARSLADIDWVMARCAGYDAGVDIYITPEQVRKCPFGTEALDTIRQWTEAIEQRAFTEDQKQTLRDVTQNVTLHRNSAGQWELRAAGKSNPEKQ